MADTPEVRTPPKSPPSLPAAAESTRASVEEIQPRIDAYVDRLEGEVASALEDAYRLLAGYRQRQEAAIDELMTRAQAEIDRVVGRVGTGTVGPRDDGPAVAGWHPPSGRAVPSGLPSVPAEFGQEPATTPVVVREGVDQPALFADRLTALWDRDESDGGTLDDAFDRFWTEDGSRPGGPAPTSVPPPPGPLSIRVEDGWHGSQSDEPSAAPAPSVVAPPTIEHRAEPTPETSVEQGGSWRRFVVAVLKEIAVPVLVAIVLIPLVLALGLIFFTG